MAKKAGAAIASKLKSGKGRTLKTALPYIMLAVSIVGLIASFALTYDKIQVLKDPNYVPNCNINPVLSCGSVMKTEQASLLGVPNTIFGLMGFSALATLSVVLLAGATFKRWLWQIVNLFAAGGLVFFGYLFFQGVYRINAICPFCFAIWMVVPPLFWYVTLYNLREGNIGAKLSQKYKDFLQKHHGDILIAWYALIFFLLLNHFWYYWKTLV